MIRYVATLLALLLVTALASADGERGMLKGTVTLDGGAPCTNTQVTVSVGGAATRFTTDTDGVFTGMVATGVATVACEGATATCTVRAGEINLVTLVLKPTTGVLLTVQFPDGTPHKTGLAAAYRLADPTWPKNLPPQNHRTQARLLAPGRYWLSEVPAEAIALSVKANLLGDGYNGEGRQQWTFDKAEALRTLTMTVPLPVPTLLTVTDAAGKPLANTPIAGRMACVMTPAFTFFPDDRQREPLVFFKELRLVLKTTTTDAEGRLKLGALVPQKYVLALTIGNAPCEPLPFEVKADDTETRVTCPVRQGRATVTQTVFDAAGNPVPGAEVCASFCRGGQVVIQRGTANEAGTVVWKDLPRARVIVSGPKVTAGVIPAEGEAFTQPLPAPTPGETRTMRVTMQYKAEKPIVTAVVLRGPAGRGTLTDETTTRGTGHTDWQIVPGTKATLLRIMGIDPLQAELLPEVYLPYLEEGVPQMELVINDLPFTKTDSITIHGKLLAADGTPTRATLEIKPADDTVMGDLHYHHAFNRLLHPTTGADGTFTVILPAIGAYSFGMRQEHGGHLSLQTLTLQPGMPAPTVTLTLPR